MIILEDLKPILEPILEGREDASSVIEQVMEIDKPMNSEPVDVEAINAEWQSKLDTAMAEAKQDKEDTIKRMFFGSKSEDIDTSIPEVPEAGAKNDDASETEEIDPETITIDDLFEKEIIS